MTGYGAADGPAGAGTIRVEIRTVNHRYFNPAIRLPPELGSHEGALRDLLRQGFERGNVSVTVRRQFDAPGARATLRLDVDRAREAMARLRELQTAVGLSGEIPLDLLARQPDVLALTDEEATAPEWEAVEPLVRLAMEACRAMRRREGEALGSELRERLANLARLADDVERLAPLRLERERARLRDAVQQLLDGRPADPDRLAQEVALLADRLDIREELVRLRTHLTSAVEALAASGPVGKQLGFLAQEMGREINTVGSKANDAAIAQRVVAMKGELERVREQVENLE